MKKEIADLQELADSLRARFDRGVAVTYLSTDVRKADNVTFGTIKLDVGNVKRQYAAQLVEAFNAETRNGALAFDRQLRETRARLDAAATEAQRLRSIAEQHSHGDTQTRLLASIASSLQARDAGESLRGRRLGDVEALYRQSSDDEHRELVRVIESATDRHSWGALGLVADDTDAVALAQIQKTRAERAAARVPVEIQIAKQALEALESDVQLRTHLAFVRQRPQDYNVLDETAVDAVLEAAR